MNKSIWLELRLCGLALGLTIFQACKTMPPTDVASAQLITTSATDKDVLEASGQADSIVPPETNTATEISNRSFRVKIWSDTPRYQTLEAHIQAQDSGVSFILKVLPTQTVTEPTPEIQTYRALIPQAEFETFWQTLEALEVGQLSDATANGPSADNPTILQHVSDAPTYQFAIQTQSPVLDHRFEVYGPRHVSDQRYQQLVVTFEALLTATFGEHPFTAEPRATITR